MAVKTSYPACARARSRSFAGVSAALVLLVSICAAAGEYPMKPVRLVVPFAPGGTTDIVARVVAQKLAEIWKKQVVIDNRGGAGGSIGTELVAKAPADGYTLLFGLQTTHAINPAVYKDLQFDPIKDFTPVTRVAFSPQLLAVHPGVPASALKEFVALAKASPGKYSYHIPYKGMGPAITELLGGHVQAAIGGLVALLPHVKSGKLRAIAMASTNRSTVLPEVPTMAESLLPGFNVSPWFGLFYPAGTPGLIVNQLYADVTSKVLSAPDVRQKISEQGAEVASSSSRQEFAAFVAAENALWGKVVREVMSGKPGSHNP
jgi:tripartite-type tricarboxylate transporter receptor subunit TctC